MNNAELIFIAMVFGFFMVSIVALWFAFSWIGTDMHIYMVLLWLVPIGYIAGCCATVAAKS